MTQVQYKNLCDNIHETNFINLHVLMCEGILGVLDDVSAGVRVSAVLALSQVFVLFFIKSTHVNELACMPACR